MNILFFFEHFFFEHSFPDRNILLLIRNLNKVLILDSNGGLFSQGSVIAGTVGIVTVPFKGENGEEESQIFNMYLEERNPEVTCQTRQQLLVEQGSQEW